MTDVFAAEAAEIAALEKQVAATPSQEAEPVETPEPQGDPDQPEREEVPEGEGPTVTNKNPSAFVRRRDLIEQTERREAAEKRSQELEARLALEASRAAERLAKLEQHLLTPKPQAEPEIQIPDKNVDPIGYFEAKQAILEKRLADAESWKQEQTKSSDDDIKRQRIATEVTRLESEYAKATPDYPQAQEFLQKAWAAEAQVLGVPPQQAIRFYAEQVVRAAAQSNRNPGEIAYEFAKARGYAKANGTQQPKTGPSIETLQRGVAASRSTSAAPGTATPGIPTIDALLKMDDDEFASKFAARDSREWDKTMRKLMGAA